MKLWRRRRSPDITRAESARREAEKQLERTRAETPVYKALAESLRDLRERNNFSEAIQSTFRGREP